MANVDKILILLLQYIIHQYVLKVKLKKDKDKIFSPAFSGLLMSKVASLFSLFVFFFLSGGGRGGGA